MKNQNCRVGSVTQLNMGANAIPLLEQQYRNFMEKASQLKYTNTQLAEFLECKAERINALLKKLSK
ncbi:MAG: hypothetical protein R3299_00415 [Arenibacter sp.]|nr:hypothetical protein [Arenibacter sp.]